MIPENKLKEFKKIYKDQFNEELSDKEALEKATRLISLYKTVYGTIDGKKKDENKKRY